MRRPYLSRGVDVAYAMRESAGSSAAATARRAVYVG